MSDDEIQYRLTIYFTDGTTQVLVNVNPEGLDEWNEQLLIGKPFLNIIGEVPWYFDPEHIFRTKAELYNG